MGINTIYRSSILMSQSCEYNDMKEDVTGWEFVRTDQTRYA